MLMVSQSEVPNNEDPEVPLGYCRKNHVEQV